jgi:hypothetical protein
LLYEFGRESVNERVKARSGKREGVRKAKKRKRRQVSTAQAKGERGFLVGVLFVQADPTACAPPTRKGTSTEVHIATGG